MKKGRVVLFISLVVLGYGCTSKETELYKKDSQSVLEQLDKIRTAVEIGINYKDYSSKIGDANYHLSNFIDKYQKNERINKLNSYKAISNAIENYKAAKTFWSAKVEEPYSQNLEYDLKIMSVDELIKLEFFSAAIFIKNAKVLLNNSDKEKDTAVAKKFEELNKNKDAIANDMTMLKTTNRDLPNKMNEVQDKIKRFKESFGSTPSL